MKRASLLSLVVVAAVIAGAYAMTRSGPFPEPVIAPQGAAAPRPPGTTVEVTYIANEGVLIVADGTQVLIDGLHREYRPAYPFLPQPHRDRIEAARPPFDRIDVILVSHVHLDHFHPEAVASHLRHNPKTVLVSSEQVVREIEAGAADYGAIKSRITTVAPASRQKVATIAGGVPIEILNVGHGSGRHATVQNLGHVITLGGKKLLHIGDAVAEAGIFDPFNLDEHGIDVAFLPMWFLISDAGADLVRNHIKPKHIVAVHMPAEDPERAATQIRERFPAAVSFTALLEKRYY